MRHTTENLQDETTFLQPHQLAETSRSLLSATNRAVINQANSILPKIQSKDDISKRISAFADLLPRKSLNPPKLEQATTFEELLRPPMIFEETASGRKKIDLEQKRLMIQEALQRIRSSTAKSKFKPRLPEKDDTEDELTQQNNEFSSENKFEDYEDQSTWGPVTAVDEYTSNSDNSDTAENLQKIMEEHTESNFGMDISNVPNMMESTLLKLLTKTNNDIETFHSDQPKLSGNKEGRLSKLQVVSVNNKDPLNKDVREFAANDDYSGEAPRQHQNPFLSLLKPSKQDYSDNIFTAPQYKQDPFLRLLRKNPKNFQDDFLTLPPKDQNELLKILMKAGKDIDIDQLIPPNYRQNPLLRLLVPQYKDSIGNLSPPDVENNLLLNAVMQDPGKFANDFLILSDEDKKEVLDLIDQSNNGSFKMELLVPNKSERLRILSNHTKEEKKSRGDSHKKRPNPLLEILEGDKRDEFDKDNFDVPLYKQDPLMRQLRIHPEKFKDDFLELPDRKQDTLLKVLKKSGIPRWNIDRLTPPNFEHNPLLRMIGEEEKASDTSTMIDLLEQPENFTKEFKDLGQSEKLKVIEVLSKETDVDNLMKKLVPDEEERLQIMIKNPLERFIEGSKQDEADKNILTPPKYRQDPLLRQLRLQPEMYHSDFLELPRRKQDTLLKLLKKSGLETMLMERLIPPGDRQDPLLRALISNNDDQIEDLSPPAKKENLLLRMLEPDKRDLDDKMHLNLSEKEEVFRSLIEDPESFTSDFEELTDDNQAEIAKMVNKSGTKNILKILAPKKFEKLRIAPAIEKVTPDYTQSNQFRDSQISHLRNSEEFRELDEELTKTLDGSDAEGTK